MSPPEPGSSGAPYQIPPHRALPGAPGQLGSGPAPGFGGPPGAVPQSGRRIGWIGGAIGTIVILLALTGGVFLVLDDSSDGDQPGGQASATPTEVPTRPSSRPGGGPRPTGEVTGSYVHVDDLCEAVDFAPVFDVLPADPLIPPDHGGSPPVGDWILADSSCRQPVADGSSNGEVVVVAYTFRNPFDARPDYESTVEPTMSTMDRIEDVDGPWEEGRLGSSDDTNPVEVVLCALDENLNLTIDFYVFGDATIDEMRGAVLALADSILRAMTR